MAAIVPEDEVIRLCLTTCGITANATRVRLANHLFGDFQTTCSMTEKTVRSHLKTMVEHRTANQRIDLAPLICDRVVGLFLWIKDQDRIGVRPDHNTFTLDEMREAMSRERIRVHQMSQTPANKPEPVKGSH